MKQESTFTIIHSLRDGVIRYQSGENSREIYWEMSGSPEHDILVAPMDLREWDAPKGLPIPRQRQMEILQELRAWAKEQRLRTNADLPSQLLFEDQPCIWAGCNERRLKGLASCIKHYDESMLRR